MASNYYNNVGRGFLSKNKYKKSDKEPFFKGKATVNGEELEVAGWIKDKETGQIISLSFDSKIAPETPPHQRDKGQTGLEELFSETVNGDPKKLSFE